MILQSNKIYYIVCLLPVNWFLNSSYENSLVILRAIFSHGLDTQNGKLVCAEIVHAQ